MGMNYLVAAYMLIWTVLCVFLVQIFRRQGKLLGELKRLRDEMKRAGSESSTDS